MPKRSYGDSLTGGSRDVNPQTMLMTGVVQSAADTLTTFGTGLPIPRLPITKGRSLVIEVLSVWFWFAHNGYVAGQQTWQSLALTTNPAPVDTATAGNNIGGGFFGDPRTIAQVTKQQLASAAPTAFASFDAIEKVDLTDDAGHGYLVATDNLYLSMSSLNTASANGGECKILYRFKDVSLEEYIGIVQSQQ
jgi:hypothetical protein